jgi:hypothetical protein
MNEFELEISRVCSSSHSVLLAAADDEKSAIGFGEVDSFGRPQIRQANDDTSKPNSIPKPVGQKMPIITDYSNKNHDCFESIRTKCSDEPGHDVSNQTQEAYLSTLSILDDSFSSGFDQWEAIIQITEVYLLCLCTPL